MDHLLKGRKEWDEIYKPRLQLFGMKRINAGMACIDGQRIQFDQGGREMLLKGDGGHPYGLYCGGLIGTLRDWLGLVNLSYLTGG